MNQDDELLAQGLAKYDLSHLQEPLMQYLHLLNKWNQAYNLTAVRDLQSMISKHVLDSLAIVPWVLGSRILDIGTGAGLPGIPLALAKPNTQVVLVDANGKKIRFLHEVQRQLQLKNVEIVQIRAENYHPDPGFDTVLSRAFSSLSQMVQWTEHLIAPQGIWLAMKGRYPETELTALNRPYRVETYTVTGLESERCCVIIENSSKE